MNPIFPTRPERGARRRFAACAVIAGAVLSIVGCGSTDPDPSQVGAASDPTTPAVPTTSDVPSTPVVVGAEIATFDEWCASAAEATRLLDGVEITDLAVAQATHREAAEVLARLVGGVGLIDPARQSDVSSFLTHLMEASGMVIAATDLDSLPADLDAYAATWAEDSWATADWVGEQCGLWEPEPIASDGGAVDFDSVEAAPPGPDRSIPMIVDQSPTVSDVGALLFLAGRSDVDLLAVTLPQTGESDCEPGVRTSVGVLAAAGRSDVPVACGVERPDAARPWPADWKASANELADVIDAPPVPVDTGDAVALLAATLADAPAPVTIVALGPLTNLSELVIRHPDVVDRIERVVVMGGAVDVPGNVEQQADAEWNLYADPVAADRLLTAGVTIDLVPLDATDGVPLTSAFVDEVASIDGPLADVESRVLGTVADLGFMFLWDETTAVGAVNPETLTWEDRKLVVTGAGATVDDPAGSVVRVATGANSALVQRTVLDALAEGKMR